MTQPEGAHFFLEGVQFHVKITSPPTPGLFCGVGFKGKPKGEEKTRFEGFHCQWEMARLNPSNAGG